MAKIRSPLFSLSASGSIAGVLTYNQSATQPTARRKPTGYAAPTTPQQFYRDQCRQAAQSWSSIPLSERQDWTALAALSGRQVFAKYLLEWIAQRSTPAAPPFIPMA